MAQSRDSLLAVLRRTCDPNWLDGLLADPDSSALLYAQLDILVATSDAADRGCDAGLISLAPGGRPGVTTLTASRADTSGSATIPKGYQFITDKGVALILTLDVPVAIGQAVVALPLQTLRQTFLLNTVDDAFDFVGTGAYLDTAVDPGSAVISDGTDPILGPAGTATGDHFLTLTTSDPIILGELDWLSAHGNERGQRRQAQETTEDYRLRVRNIQDTVSPHALSQAIRGVGNRVGIAPITIREPFDDGADEDARAREGLGVIEPYYASATLPPATSPMVDFLDDPYFAPSPLPPDTALKIHELVDIRSGRAYFRIDTPDVITEPTPSVMFCDDGFCDDPVLGYPDLHVHPGLISALMAIWEEANRKRAAAVQFDVMLPLYTRVDGAGDTITPGPTTVVTLTAPTGKEWVFVDLVASHDAALSGTYPDPTADSHLVKFTFPDASTFTTPAFARLDSEHLTPARLAAMGFPLGTRISQIEGILDGAGISDLNMVVNAQVIEVTA